MALILSQLISQAYTDRLATAFHVVLAGCVFAFLAMMITLSGLNYAVADACAEALNSLGRFGILASVMMGRCCRLPFVAHKQLMPRAAPVQGPSSPSRKTVLGTRGGLNSRRETRRGKEAPERQSREQKA